MNRFWHISGVVAVLAFGVSACSGTSREPMDPNFSGYPDTPFTIRDAKDLIGGPVAQGRVGDVLLKNERIRVVIQKPRKNSGVNSFGGNIIDADLVRSSGAGQDNFGSIFPLVNIEWTVNYHNYEVLSEGKDGGPKVLRAYGKIDAYDYLDLDFIGDVAQGVAGIKIAFNNRFDDRDNPFSIYEDLKAVSWDVTTDYTLEPGKNFVRIDTTFSNVGEVDAKFPVGQFINGSGQNSILVPGVGFTPDLMTQVGTNTPAVIYAAFDGVDVSYGYFYDAGQFVDPEAGSPYTTTSVSFSGLTGLLFGEEFLKLAPLGGGSPEIHFSVPAGASRTITGYFVVGDGSAGSVMDSGLSALGAAVRPISGVVKTADGKPFSGATVAVASKGATLVTYRTGADGRFSGSLPTGGNDASKRFGSGKYSVIVDAPGYHMNTTSEAGSCEPKEIDLSTMPSAAVECTLGETGVVALSGPVIDAQTGSAVVARLTIVGDDPSPNKVGSAGRFFSTYDWDQPFGISTVRYITAGGTFDLTGSSEMNLEPGTYRFVVSRGPEYGAEELMVDVVAGERASLGPIDLARAVQTPGWIAVDMHVHSIASPDSSLSQEMRVLSAAGEGLDILQSTDHDYITDYEAAAGRLEAQGLIPPDSIKVASGDEVTPNHYGHFNLFPLTPDHSDSEGGAFDWSGSDREDVSPAPDYVWTLPELIPRLRESGSRPIVQLNHIMDMPTGLPLAAGWVTSPFYLKGFGVAPLSAYADPLERRMPSGGASFPVPFESSGLVTVDYDSIELMIGFNLNDPGLLMRSSLPTWFNLLNLGVIATATSDSDSHTIFGNPVGLPRNFIASSVDPRDGRGSFGGISLSEYADSIRAGRVTVSAGPVVMMKATSSSGATAGIGDVLSGKKATFTVEVKAPSWAWFDTIEVYANTEPIPADDETGEPMQGTAADPSVFYRPYHAPVYAYEPFKSFRLMDGTLESWKEEDGVITATATFDIEVTEDTWVMAMARGTKSTKGFRSPFPVVTRSLSDSSVIPEGFDPSDLSAFHADKNVASAAWGFANPIFIDADGGGFTAKYVREGVSPIQ